MLRFEYDAAKLAAAALTGTVASYWAATPDILKLLVWLMAFDILSGVIVGLRNGGLDSHIAGPGMRKKVMQVLLVSLAWTLEAYAPAEFTVGGVGLVEATAGAFAFVELVSILENAQQLIPLPGPLAAVLAQARKGEDERVS